MLSRIRLDALLDREQRLLGRVHGDGDDQLVDEGEAAPHEIFVAARDGIEAAGVDRDGHELVGCGTVRRGRIRRDRK